jgi:hypothetical protein
MMRGIITDFENILREVLDNTESLFQEWESTDRGLRCVKALAVLMRVVEVTNKFEVLSHHIKKCFPPIVLTNYDDWCKSIDKTKSAIQDVVKSYIVVEQVDSTDFDDYLKEMLRLEVTDHQTLVALERQLTNSEKTLLNTLEISFDYLLEILNVLQTTLTGDRSEVLAMLYMQAEARYKNNVWEQTERSRYLKHLENTKFPWGYEPTVEQLRKLYGETFNEFSQTKLGKIYDEFRDDDLMAIALGISNSECSTDELNEFFKQTHRLRELKLLAEKKEKGLNIFNKEVPMGVSETISEERNFYPLSSFDSIFHSALDMIKVKDGINRIIIGKGKEGKFLLSVKWWFVVHKVLEEIDWLNDKQDTKFIQWVDDVFGWEWKTCDFKSVLAGFKHTHSTKWDVNTVKDMNTGRQYRELADYVRNMFVIIDSSGKITDKQEFLKLGSDGKPMYIGHDLRRYL